MIRVVKSEELADCSEVIKKSFTTVADEFNITSENAPKYVAFSVTAEKLKQQFYDNRLMYVYEQNGHIVGFFSMYINDNDCELNNLCVLPDYRHSGIGKQLCDFAVNLAKSKNMCKINISIVEENSTLFKWYTRLGFDYTHSVKFDFFPFTCAYMEMNLQ